MVCTCVSAYVCTYAVYGVDLFMLRAVSWVYTQTHKHHPSCTSHHKSPSSTHTHLHTPSPPTCAPFPHLYTHPLSPSPHKHTHLPTQTHTPPHINTFPTQTHPHSPHTKPHTGVSKNYKAPHPTLCMMVGVVISFQPLNQHQPMDRVVLLMICLRMAGVYRCVGCVVCGGITPCVCGNTYMHTHTHNIHTYIYTHTLTTTQHTLPNPTTTHTPTAHTKHTQHTYMHTNNTPSTYIHNNTNTPPRQQVDHTPCMAPYVTPPTPTMACAPMSYAMVNLQNPTHNLRQTTTTGPLFVMYLGGSSDGG